MGPGTHGASVTHTVKHIFLRVAVCLRFNFSGVFVKGGLSRGGRIFSFMAGEAGAVVLVNISSITPPAPYDRWSTPNPPSP